MKYLNLQQIYNETFVEINCPNLRGEVVVFDKNIYLP